MSRILGFFASKLKVDRIVWLVNNLQHFVST